jgi:hypothetical protein
MALYHWQAFELTLNRAVQQIYCNIFVLEHVEQDEMNLCIPGVQLPTKSPG